MTRSSALGTGTRIDPEAADHDVVALLSQEVAGVEHVVVRLPSGRELELPAAIVKILQVSADQLSAGHAVTVLASESTLTPAEVGEVLGLSRPFVSRLLDQGQLAFEYLPGSK